MFPHSFLIFIYILYSHFTFTIFYNGHDTPVSSELLAQIEALNTKTFEMMSDSFKKFLLFQLALLQ